MKKILSLLLILALTLTCVFAFVGCGEEQTPDDDTNNNNNPPVDDNPPDDQQPPVDDNPPADDKPDPIEELKKKLEPFTLAIEKTEPTKATVNVSIQNDLLGEPMTGTWNLIYNDDGSISVEYSYQYMVEDLTAASPDTPYETKTGTATIDKDGNVTGADAQFTKVKAAALVKYNLDATKLADANVGLGVLSAKVAAADTEAVLGVNLGSDAQFTMTTVDNVISSVTVTYTVDGIPATIIASFE